MASKPSDETQPGANSNQYGDYQGIAGSPGRFFAVWADSRQGSINEDMAGARVNF
jgi:hypothetical protein